MSANATVIDAQAVPVDPTPVAAPETDVNAIVKKYVMWSAGAGLVPIPAFDMAVVAGIQAKMLKDLADHYQVDFSSQRSKVAIGALIGGIMPTQLARGFLGSIIKGIPGLGQAVGGATVSMFAAAATYAIGKVFILHFASGGTFLDFNPDSVKAYYTEQFEKGKSVAAEAIPVSEKVAPKKEKSA